MKNSLILTLALLFTANIYSQSPGVYGKKNVFYFNFQFNPTYLNTMNPKKEEGVYRFGPNVFNYSVYVGYDRLIGRKSAIGVQYTFDPCQITTHGIKLNFDGPYGANSYIVGDYTFFNHAFLINYKLYPNENIAGLGFYLKFGIGGSFVVAGNKDFLLSNTVIDGENNYSGSYLDRRVPSNKEQGIHRYYISDTYERSNFADFMTRAGLFNFALGWDTAINSWLGFNVELGTTFVFGYKTIRDKSEKAVWENTSGWFTRDRVKEYGDLYKDLEYRVRLDQNQKQLLRFSFGLRFMI